MSSNQKNNSSSKKVKRIEFPHRVSQEIYQSQDVSQHSLRDPNTEKIYLLQNNFAKDPKTQRFYEKVKGKINSATDSIKNNSSKSSQQLMEMINPEKIKKEISDFNSEKLQLIRLYKLQIAQLEEKYNEKCKELDFYKKSVREKDQCFQQQLTFFQQKDDEIRKFNQQIMHEKEKIEFGSIKQDEKELDLLKREKEIDQQKKNLENHQRNLDRQEELYKKKIEELNEKKKIIEQREKDGLILQIRVCDTKRVLDEYNEQLKAKEQDLQTRINNFNLKEKELQNEIIKVKQHGEKLSELMDKLNFKIQDLDNLDEKIVNKYIQKRYPQNNIENNFALKTIDNYLKSLKDQSKNNEMLI